MTPTRKRRWWLLSLGSMLCRSWVGFFAATTLVLVFVMVPTIVATGLPVLHLTNVLAAG